MKRPFRALASAVLHTTTTPSGQSTLPDWLLTPLAMAAGDDSMLPTRKDSGWTDEGLLRKAIALYRAASARSGGQAAVSWQFSTNGRQAVQVLPPLADRFQQQAFAELSRRMESVTMNHPRLAPVLEAAVQQGYPYLAARIGDGFQALTKRFALPLEPELAMRIAQQVTSALEYAHYRNLIHGSFDLHDILVNEEGQASLLGIGVEQLRQRLGATGASLVTPLLPPEVESGAQPADKRADVFAMGALFYILLTGRVPAAGQKVVLSQSIPTVPAAVDAVLTQALAIDPNDRYPSLLEMNRELRVALRAPRAVTRPSVSPVRRIDAAQARRSSLTTLSSRAPQPVRPPATTPDGFPEQLPMPEIDFSALEMALEMPQIDAFATFEIPPAPEIPKIDWAEMLHPVDVSAFSSEVVSLPYAAAETLAPDPLVAAAMAVQSTEQTQQSRQRSARRAEESAPQSQAAPPPAQNLRSAAKPRRARRQ